LLAVLLTLAGCFDQSVARAAEPTVSKQPAMPAGANRDAPRDNPGADIRWLPSTRAAPRPLALDAAGRLVALGTPCECIVYDLTIGKELHRWNDGTRVVQFTRNGRFLVAINGHRVTLWSTDDFIERARIQGNPPAWREGTSPDRVHAGLSDDASLIAVINTKHSFDRDRPAGILIYDRDGRLQHTLPMPETAWMHRHGLAFLRGDRLLLSYGATEAQRMIDHADLWNPTTGQLVQAFPANEIAVGSDDGRWIATRPGPQSPSHKRDSTLPPPVLSILDVESGKEHRVLRGIEGLRDIAWRPDGERLLATINGGLVEWDVATGDIVFERDGDPFRERYAHVGYSPDCRRRFATREEPNGIDDDVDAQLCGWDGATDELLPLAAYEVGYNSNDELFFFPKGDRFIDLEQPFEVRDVLTGETVQKVPEYRIPITEATFLGDDHFLIGNLLTDAVSGNQRQWNLPGSHRTAIRDGRVIFAWDYFGVSFSDAASGITEWRNGPQYSLSLIDGATDPGGRRIVLAHRESWAPLAPRVIVMDTSRPDQPLVLHRWASAVAVYPDATRFLAASHAGIDELDVETGEVVRSLATPPGRVMFITVSPDGSWILTGGVRGHENLAEPVTSEFEGWAMLVEAASGKTIPLDGHSGGVTTGAFSGDGTRCATGSLDTTIRLWAIPSGKEVHCFRGHRGAINRIAYSPAGDRILSAAEDGPAMWNVAGVVDPSASPRPLADSFTIVETFTDTFLGPALADSKVFPANPAGAHAPLAAMGKVDWPIIHVGGTRVSPDFLRDWLSGDRAIVDVPAASWTASPEPFAGYHLRGASRDGRRRLLTSFVEHSFIIADDEDNILARGEISRDGQAVAMSPSGKEFVLAHAVERSLKPGIDGRYRITIHDSVTGEINRTIEDIPAQSIHKVHIDPLERTLLLTIANKNLDLRDYATGKQLAKVKDTSHGASLRTGYSPDGRFIATTAWPLPVFHLRDPLTLKTIRTLDNHLLSNWSRFTPNGRRLLVGQRYAKEIDLVTAWDVESGTRLWSRCGPAGMRGTFSSDGRRYLTDFKSNCWALWDLERGIVCCLILTHEGGPPVFAAGGNTVHDGTPDGPQLWPLVDKP
jgi:WD40 repeat protein